MTADTTLREQVARVIHPEAFRPDGACEYKYVDNFHRALAKADAILALIPDATRPSNLQKMQNAPGEVGEAVAWRKIADAVERAASHPGLTTAVGVSIVTEGYLALRQAADLIESLSTRVKELEEAHALRVRQVHSAVEGAQPLWSGDYQPALDRAQAAESLNREAAAPIGMQDVRLHAGEGKLAAHTVLQAVNAILNRRREASEPYSPRPQNGRPEGGEGDG